MRAASAQQLLIAGAGEPEAMPIVDCRGWMAAGVLRPPSNCRLQGLEGQRRCQFWSGVCRGLSAASAQQLLIAGAGRLREGCVRAAIVGCRIAGAGEPEAMPIVDCRGWMAAGVLRPPSNCRLQGLEGQRRCQFWSGVCRGLSAASAQQLLIAGAGRLREGCVRGAIVGCRGWRTNGDANFGPGVAGA